MKMNKTMFVMGILIVALGMYIVGVGVIEGMKIAEAGMTACSTWPAVEAGKKNFIQMIPGFFLIVAGAFITNQSFNPSNRDAGEIWT